MNQFRVATLSVFAHTVLCGTYWFSTLVAGARSSQAQTHKKKKKKKNTDNLPAETLFPAKGCQIAWKSQVK
jgi:NAD(P)H-dependent flavin oxidoreductase YrpB (nitropropane dioxygenase family)